MHILDFINDKFWKVLTILTKSSKTLELNLKFPSRFKNGSRRARESLNC